MSSVIIAGDTSGTITLTAPAVAGSGVLTLPVATDTLVGKATTDTLTNKTLTGAVINGTVGATTPAAGAFTTLSATGAFTGTTGAFSTSLAVTAAGPTFFTATPTTGTNRVQLVAYNTGVTMVTGVESSAGGAVFTGAPAYAAVFGNLSATATCFATNSTTRMLIDSSGNVGIGTSSPDSTLRIDSTNGSRVRFGFTTGGIDYGIYQSDQGGVDANYFSNNVGIGTTSPGALLHVGTTTAKIRIGATAGSEYLDISRDSATGNMIYNAAQASFGTHNFQIAGTEAMRIDSSGNLLVGTTSAFATPVKIAIVYPGDTTWGIGFKSTYNSGAGQPCTFINTSNIVVGYINTTSTVTAYNTSSDYRLKEDIAPMTGALAKVALLKPVNFKWKSDGSDAEGFIAHELAEVCPNAVNGEKDAVDADGNPKYQGIDTSFLVATLTAAIQELKAIIDTQATRIAALEAKA